MSDWRQMDLEELTSSLEDTPASHLVTPGNEEARKMTVTSGQKLKGSWLPSGPLGVCLRTLLDTSAWASTKCFLTWKAKDTPRGRQLFQLAPSMPRTDETEFGLWPTARSCSAMAAENIQNRVHDKFPNLETMVARSLWPTPLTVDAKNNGNGSGRHSSELNGVVGGSLNPTWVEWLMGFPLGWTDLNASETPSCPKSSNGSDAKFLKKKGT